MTSATGRRWPSPEDQMWADRVLWRLVMHENVSNDLADEVLFEAHQACQEAQRPAVEMFGDPDDFAAGAARDRVPEADRAAVDLDGASPQDRWTIWFLVLGWGTLLLGLLLLVTEGWTIRVTAWGLAVFTAAVGLGTGMHWGLLERRAGLVRRGWAWWVAGAAALAGALAVGTLFQDRPTLFAAPTVLVPVAGVLAMVIGFTFPRRRPRSPRRLHQPATSPQHWFDDLAGVLRGRYLLTRREVTSHVEEARSFWADSGAVHPAAEFGTAAEYALRLMDGSPAPARGKARGKAWTYSAAAAFWCWMVGDEAVTDGLGWGLAWRVAALVFFASSALREWRQLRRCPAAQLQHRR